MKFMLVIAAACVLALSQACSRDSDEATHAPNVPPNGMPGAANTSASQREIAATDEATAAPLQETAHDYVTRRPERESLAAGEITSNAESSRIWQPTCRP